MSTPDALPVSLSVDEEHGGFFGRWYCQLCDAAGIDDEPCPNEESALVAARTSFIRNHSKHARARS